MARTVVVLWKAVGAVVLFAGIVLYVSLYLDVNDVPRRCDHIDETRHSAFYNRRGSSRPVWKYVAPANEDGIRKQLKIRLRAASEKKFILLWKAPFANKVHRKPIDRAQCGNCEITYDRSLIEDHQTGAVVHHFDSLQTGDIPKARNPNQLHIFWAMESPATLRSAQFTLDVEERFGMNATMTYRLESDFLVSYEISISLDKIMGNNDSIYGEIMKQKSKLALSVISDCDLTPGARLRLDLINELKSARLDIDTYGACFGRKIGAEDLFKSIPKYKFYFAYENSHHCADYITEKFFVYALYYSSVPVVWGATKEDYATVAPPGSFIFAEEFQSPRHLIAFLQYLDQNDEEYLRFFRWRTMKPEESLPQFGRQQGFCAVCRALHGINTDYRFNPGYNKSYMPMFSNGIAKRVVPSVQHFFYKEENPECFNNY